MLMMAVGSRPQGIAAGLSSTPGLKSERMRINLILTYYYSLSLILYHFLYCFYFYFLFCRVITDTAKLSQAGWSLSGDWNEIEVSMLNNTFMIFFLSLSFFLFFFPFLCVRVCFCSGIFLSNLLDWNEAGMGFFVRD